MNPLAEFILGRNAALRAAADKDPDDLEDWPSCVQGRCDAVEQLVRLHVNDDPCRYQREGGCETLRLLGTMYADDPEYRDEWRPVDWPHGQYGPTADYGNG